MLVCSFQIAAPAFLDSTIGRASCEARHMAVFGPCRNIPIIPPVLLIMATTWGEKPCRGDADINAVDIAFKV